VTEDDEIKATIDREAELLASAVRLVASGGARRTTVGGLRLSEAAIAIVRPMAADLGVELEPLWRTDEQGLDVLVRRAVAPEGPA
jgi:diphthamide synthase (EF-2-diphthine--ammonia ligase)